MMKINFSTDLGDKLGHPFDQFYPTRYCNAAYKRVINHIIHAMSQLYETKNSNLHLLHRPVDDHCR